VPLPYFDAALKFRVANFGKEERTNLLIFLKFLKNARSFIRQPHKAMDADPDLN
jgi:hypothetical protein